MENRNCKRIFLLLEYLFYNTDERHSAKTDTLILYLSEKGIPAHRQTISSDIVTLQEFGFDIITVRSRQNLYYYGGRIFDPAELKIIGDAILASNSTSKKQSEKLIEKLLTLVSIPQSEELRRQLSSGVQVKGNNEQFPYTIDLLQQAISDKKRVKFQYCEMSQNKKKILKHKGYFYEFSPYDMVWENDCYYVFGYSEKHEKVITFRVDRIHKPTILLSASRPKPEDYNPSVFLKQTFSMYDEQPCTVRLLCDNDMMKHIVDKFGESVQTQPSGDVQFIATVDVSVSRTFFGWIFSYNGKIRILGPETVLQQYREQLTHALKSC